MAAHYFRNPSLRLNGNWLEEAGLSTDTPITVSVERGRLVIEPVNG
ncbi:SymE family type I addiction module toxin [Enterobacter soli]